MKNNKINMVNSSNNGLGIFFKNSDKMLNLEIPLFFSLNFS